jgi:4-carboxymuconolactone decarboxylase
MSKSETYKKGLEVRQELMGEAAVSNLTKDVYNDPIMGKFGDFAFEGVFGLLWTRPGLDRKTRTLIVVITDTVTHAWPELEIHLKMARRQGWTEDELAEAILHTAGYIGVPTVREALIIAKRIFAEFQAEEKERE